MNDGSQSRNLLWCKRVVTVCLLVLLSFVDIQYFFTLTPNILSTSKTAAAAEVTIDAVAAGSAAEFNKSGSATVFIDDQIGYKFFKDSTNDCRYSKTTNGGASWGTAVVFDTQTDCRNPVVWYDGWTPGDTGSYIHISSMDTSVDEVWYNRLDTTDDSLLVSTSISASVGSSQTGGFNSGANKQSITKGTDGTVYIAISDNGDSYVVECSSTCNSTGSWTETGTNPLDLAASDFNLMMPLSGGSILLINRDASTNDIRSKVWNNTSWSASWNVLDASAPENNAYDVSMSAAVNPNTGDIFLAYVADHNNFTVADHDIRTAVYSSGSWSTKTNIITNDTRGLTNVALGIDVNTNDVYVAYAARSTLADPATTDIFWASSTAAMTTWGSEQGAINTASSDFFGLDLNHTSNQRLYASWYDNATAAILGDTILDTTPTTIVTTSGTQVTEVRASTTDVYLGGTFIISEYLASRNVTDITITENASVAADTDLDNIKLYYDLDTSAPYDCASESYSGTESQFGLTDTNGFSGGNGVSSFTDSVNITSTQTMCVYVVLDVLTSASDGQTIDVEISNPTTDVVVTGGTSPTPDSAVALSGDTDILNSSLIQAHYHWRNDDGNETGATSATGGSEDTALTNLPRNVERRVRFSVYNNGSTSTLPTTLQLEYGLAAPTCSAISSWTDVDATDDAWNMFDSGNIVNGSDTTNIATSTGGVTDSDSSFLSPNGALLDTSSEVTGLVLTDTNFVEIEYAIIASTSASQGSTYCFRLSEAGDDLTTYLAYPEVTIAADVEVTATGTQTASAEIPTTGAYIGGAFVFTETGGSRNITDITITESGTIDASASMKNVELYYDLDTSAPYNCASESYGGTESQFGATDVDGFSAADGTASFSGTVGISTTQAVCMYVVSDITTSAQNGNTIEISINNPSLDVSVSSSGSVSPSTPIAVAGSTETTGSIVTQVHYHWRNDDGNETGATSATGGSEDTAVTDFAKSTPIRLRIGLSNEGGTSSIPHRYELEYGIKITTCDAVGTWTDVDAFVNDSWDLYNSTFVTHGSDTTDIAVSAGGVSDEEALFIASNAGMLDTESFTATTTIASNEYVDYEFSLTTTPNTPFETDFCLRLVENGVPLVAYDNYAELTTTVKRDFKIQRGTSTLSGTGGTTLTAGVDYTAPASSSAAFVRITNTHHTGAGHNLGGGNQNPDDVTAYITSATDLTTSFTLTRDTDAINNTYVAWEIIEFIGDIGTDNEMIVRDVGTVNMGSSASAATGSVVSSIVDDGDVVVFITATALTSNNRSDMAAGHVTADWNNGTDQPTFLRGANNVEVDISYAVVEFTGINWDIQRVEHDYVAAGVTETEPIDAINSITKAFLETQKRMELHINLDDYGHQVYLSGIGAVSFYLDPSVDTPTDHTSVAWVIENTQTGTGAMVVYQSNGLTSGGAEPSAISVSIGGSGVNDTNNASIFAMSTQNQTGRNHPRTIAGIAITSTSTYEVWRSDTGGTLAYRTEVVQWPAADTAVRQNYYRLYVNNSALKPTDPWPVGGDDLGENTSMTALDDPIAEGEELRLRMSALVTNGTLAAGLLTLKLQYGLRDTTCSAIGSWADVGAAGGGSIWRFSDDGAVSDGTNLSGNPPTGGDLVLSVSDRAGDYLESAPSPANPFSVSAEEDVEYDWLIEHNGAVQRSNYCFRMVRGDGSDLDGYLNYPQVRTEGYAPATESWQWFDDELNETPVSPLAGEDIAPSEIAKSNTLKLRITVNELNNLAQNNARFKLQFSETSDFSVVSDVVSTTTCTSTDIWCYADGAGFDNATITTSVISTSDSCIAGVGAGCGVHNESPISVAGFTHNALDAIENEFTIQYQDFSGYYGQVWYFRLYDVANGEAVTPNGTSTYPSLVGESGSLTLTISGVADSVVTEGITTDIQTTATSVPFGTLVVGTEYEAAHRITVDTNAYGGYKLLKYVRQPFSNSNGSVVPDIAASNATPAAWAASCGAAASCFGYHAGDDSLDGNSARFAADDSYAAFATSAAEIMYNATSTSDTEDVIYKLKINQLQQAGDYATEVVYVVVPVF